MAGETILVIEPNPVLLQFIVEELAHGELKPVPAQTPEEAANLALVQFPHLLLLHLPPEAALSLLSRLAQINCLIPTILIVEDSTIQVSINFLRLGVRDYLVSPFNGEQLVYMIKQQLEMRNGAKPLAYPPVEYSSLTLQKQEFKSLESLIKISQSIHTLLDQEVVLRRITEAAVSLSEADEGYLLLLDPETAELRVRTEQHLGESQAQCVNLRVKDSLADSIIQTGKPILFNSNEIQPLKIRTGYLVKALIAIPIKIDERVIGVLGVSNRKTNCGFTSEHLHQLSLLAETGGVALENARLYSEMRSKLLRRLKEFTTLQALSTQLGIITDFEVGAQLILSFILKATGAEAGVLAWSGSGPQDKLIYVSQGVLGEVVLTEDREVTQRSWWNERVLREVLDTGKAKLWSRSSTNGASGYATQAQARLTVPMNHGRQIVGVINLERSIPDAFTEDDLYFVRNVADQVSLALKSTVLQREVEASREHFSLLMDAVNHGVWLVDADLNLLAQNKAASKIMGWGSINPVGQALGELLLSENGSTSKLCQLMIQALEERQPVLFDKGIVLSLKEKSSVLIGGRIFPLIQGDESAGALCSFWKISEGWGESTTRFEFADMASHLLRTPLNLIHASVDLMINAKLDAQSQQKMLVRVKEQSDRLREFTNELLKMLRLEVEGTQVHREQVCLPPLIEKLVNLVQEEKPYLTLSFTGPQSMPMVAADRTKTELILLNLLLSAARRCPHGCDINVSLQVQDAEVVVSISDNGKPLQNKQINLVFQQFYPVDERYDKLPSTYHLGLYTTKRLVELQNGQIWAKSQPGCGSQFYFSLPIWE